MERMASESVETTTRSGERSRESTRRRARYAACRNMGSPWSGKMFLWSKRLEPPRAGMTTSRSGMERQSSSLVVAQRLSGRKVFLLGGDRQHNREDCDQQCEDSYELRPRRELLVGVDVEPFFDALEALIHQLQATVNAVESFVQQLAQRDLLRHLVIPRLHLPPNRPSPHRGVP